MERAGNPVWSAVWPTLLLVGFGIACGVGGGATFGENSPGNAGYGGGTYLDDAHVTAATPDGVGENGSLAVDPDTEFTYTLQKRLVDGEEEKRIVVIEPDGPARELMDVTGYVDVRVLFPAGSVLLMLEPAFSDEALTDGRCLQPQRVEREPHRCADELIWFDKSARSRLKEQRTTARYHGTRLSPKRNHLVVADNFKQPATLHLVDAASGHTNVVRQEGAWFEAMWMHAEDVLITAHFGRLNTEEDDAAYLEIREWFPSADAEAQRGRSVCYHSGDEAPQGCTSFVVAEIDPIFTTGFSWVGVSPDDRWVAVPAQRDDGTAVVLVVDRQTDELHFVDDAHGPVGFTPDSSTMIGFGFEQPYEPVNDIDGVLNHRGDGPYLAIVDLATMTVTTEPTPDVATPTFFVSRDSSDVVVVNTFGGEGLMIVDLDKSSTQEMAGPNVAERGRHLPVDLTSDPTRPNHTVDREVLSANDLVASREIRRRDDICDERVCHTGEGLGAGLMEFVSRTGHQELWLVEDSNLVRVDLEFGFAETVEIDGTPRHINILPRRDRLVIDALHEQRIRFFDPVSHRVDAESSIELGWSAR